MRVVRGARFFGFDFWFVFGYYVGMGKVVLVVLGC